MCRSCIAPAPAPLSAGCRRGAPASPTGVRLLSSSPRASRKPDGVAERVEACRDGVERHGDAAVAAIDRHFVQQIAGKQDEIAGRDRRHHPFAAVEWTEPRVLVLVGEDEIAAPETL